MKKFVLYILLVLFSGAEIQAGVTGEPFTVNLRTTVSMTNSDNNAAMAPVHLSAKKQKSSKKNSNRLKVVPFMSAPTNEKVFQGNSTSVKKYRNFAPVKPRSPSSSSNFNLDANFSALADNNTTIPPDTMGAVGPNHIMTMLNSEVKIQQKDGTFISQESLDDFWQNDSNSTFDPILLYDKNSNRWIAVADADADSNRSRLFIAISQTDDPTGNWDIYGVNASDGDNWADYPRVGINSKWIVITANMLKISDGSHVGVKMWVIDKSTAISGSSSLSGSTFATGFDDTGKESGFTLTPAVTFDNNEPNLYIVDNIWADGDDNQAIRLSEISGDASSPVWSVVSDTHGISPGDGLFYVANNYNANQTKASQKDTSDKIDTGDMRIINAVFRNGRVWFSHSAGLPAAGTPDRTAIFWYELNPELLDSTGDPIVQSGVVDPGVGKDFAFPSIAVNGKNDVVIGFSSFDNSKYAGASFVFRSKNDSAGSMSQVSTLKQGESSYSKTFGGSDVRWGDYSATVVDPSDDNSFWTLQEYAASEVNGTDMWGTWWGKIKSTSPSNQIPTANAGEDQTLKHGSTVTLDGSNSSDPDGDRLTYKWSFVSKPDGSLATLSSNSAKNPIFTADEPGTYKLSLVVNDDINDSSPGYVTITATNTAPIANAGEDQSVSTNTTVNLDGSSSSDDDGDTLTYKWSFVSKPAGSLATLFGSTDEQPTFTAYKAGTYKLSLVANDGYVDSAKDEVLIMVNKTSGSGGGGGCSYNPQAKSFDAMMLLMMIAAMLYPFRRKYIKAD